MFYCKNRNVLLTKQDLEKIPLRMTKLATLTYKGKKIIYRTLKKKNGFCVFYKNGRCKADTQPLLCRTHPLYFRLNFQDKSIVWLIASRKGKGFIQKAKKLLLEFLEKDEPKTIAIYLIKTRRLNLKPFEEEALPKRIVKKMREIKKFL